LDEVLQVDDGDAIIMAQRLSAELGISVGISSGANFLGALIAQNKIGSDANVVTIFSDCNKKYLSTDLMRLEPVKEGFYSSDIELISFRSFKRVCITCCNPDECVETYSPGDIAINELPKCVRR
jgi:cysteine synthase A